LANDPISNATGRRTRLDWSYHNYRDSDIDTYLPAIQWLAEQGVWVIRMGRLVARPLPSGMRHVIDYAFDHGKSDLLDIWLFANCTGCVSTACGPDVVSVVYEKPLLFVNALPLGLSLSWGKSIWVPKPLRWAKSGRALSVSEHLSNSWLTVNEYERAGIAIVDLSSAEITAAVKEFWMRICGCWAENEEDRLRQLHYLNTFVKWPEFSTYHGWLNSDARVGTAWLRSTPPH